MLSEAEIERYSRQILLPEVGGRGQERWRAAHVAVAGDDQAAEAAAILLGRAGVGTLSLLGVPGPLPELAPGCRLHTDSGASGTAEVVVDLTGDRARAAARSGSRCPIVLGLRRTDDVVVATLVGRPCPACALLPEPEAEGMALLDAPAALVLGAVAATEALLVLLAPPATGRVQRLALGAGRFTSTPIRTTPGCPACRVPA